MTAAREIVGPDAAFANRKRRAKRRSMGILNARSTEQRKPLYRDLLRVVDETVQSAGRILEVVDRSLENGSIQLSEQLRLDGVRRNLAHYIPLTGRVMSQTERRVFNEERVPATEKVVSIFEEHTDIIVKDRRETHYGHKIILTSGRLSLVTDFIVLKGNPTDSSLAEGAIDRHIEITGSAPRQAAFDRGFTSRANLTAIKNKGVEDVAFSKAPYLKALQDSVWVTCRTHEGGLSSERHTVPDRRLALAPPRLEKLGVMN